MIKEAEEILSPASLSALRFVIAAACFAPAAARALEDKELRKSALELGAWLFAGYTMQAIGLAETSAARSAVTGTFTVLTGECCSCADSSYAHARLVQSRPIYPLHFTPRAAGFVASCKDADPPFPIPGRLRRSLCSALFGRPVWPTHSGLDVDRGCRCSAWRGPSSGGPKDGGPQLRGRVVHRLRHHVRHAQGELISAGWPRLSTTKAARSEQPQLALSSCQLCHRDIASASAQACPEHFRVPTHPRANAGPSPPPPQFRTESVTTRFADKSAELMSLQLAVLAGAASLYALPEFAGVVANGGLDGVVEAAAGVPWVAVLWMGLATTAFTLYIEVESLKEVSAPLAALIYTSEPLWGALLAWFVLDERWGATGWVGAAMIIGSSLYSQLGGDKVEKIKAKDA